MPKFVWLWLKESSPTAIRTNRTPNLRVQDGPKQYLLCANCELLLSNWEKPFSERIFLPLHDPNPVLKPILYEEWALKFAVSVSWRVLTFFEEEGANQDFDSEQRLCVDQAREVWKKFLLGDSQNPGNFSQHLLPVDVLESYDGPKISSFLNRYFLRAVQIDIIASSTFIYVYTKMGRLILFGRIYEKHPNLWNGMKLHRNIGKIAPRKYALPEWVADYWNEKADATRSIFASMSPKQQAKIDAAFDDNIDAIANSEVFRAMQYDIAHSGREALKKETNDRPGKLSNLTNK